MRLLMWLLLLLSVVDDVPPPPKHGSKLILPEAGSKKRIGKKRCVTGSWYQCSLRSLNFGVLER